MHSNGNLRNRLLFAGDYIAQQADSVTAKPLRPDDLSSPTVTDCSEEWRHRGAHGWPSPGPEDPPRPAQRKGEAGNPGAAPRSWIVAGRAAGPVPSPPPWPGRPRYLALGGLGRLIAGMRVLRSAR